MSGTDRLYDLLPAAIRARDADVGEPLRALMAVLAGEIEAIEADIETMWDDWFVETCEPWLVPYLGEALGVRGLRDVDAHGFSLRGHVANALDRRRRKGTIAATEQLARDVTGYPARAVEMFSLTASTPHVNHVRATGGGGTVPGTVDVRRPADMQLVAGPFDPFAHTPDVRPMADGVVRHNLPNVEVFLWRLRSYELSDVTARVDPGDDQWYRFEALGRDRPIFTLPVGEQSIVTLAGPEHVPRPMPRLELASFGPDADWPIAVRTEVTTVGGTVVTELTPQVCNLADVGGALPTRSPSTADVVLVDPENGRLVVHADVVIGPDPVEVVVDLVHGWPGDVGAGPYDRNDRADRDERLGLAGAQTVRFQRGVARHPAVVGTETIVQTLEEAVVQWNAFIAGVPAADRPATAGMVVVMDSRTHAAPTTEIALPDGSSLSIVAGSWPRTEVDGVLDRHTGVVDASRIRPHVLGDIAAAGQAGAGAASAGGLVLDGLLIEGSVRIGAGDLEQVVARSCTITGVPGAIGVASDPGATNAQTAVVLDRSIVRSVRSEGPIARVAMLDSFVGDGDTAVDAPGADLDASESTLYGGVRCQVLVAQNCVFDEGTGDPSSYRITQTQEGCVRFSHVPAGASTPRRYRCQPDLAVEAITDPTERTRVIRSIHPTLDFDLADAGFGLLGATSSPALRTAGSGGLEPGVWHHLQHARRLANLGIALDQDLRFGLDTGLVLDR